MTDKLIEVIFVGLHVFDVYTDFDYVITVPTANVYIKTTMIISIILPFCIVIGLAFCYWYNNNYNWSYLIIFLVSGLTNTPHLVIHFL